MKSIPFFDDQHPVRIIYTDNADWQAHAGWQDADVRKSVIQDYLQMSLRHIFYAYEVDSSDVLTITDENFESLEAIGKEDIFERIGGYDAMVTSVHKVMLCVCTADCLPLCLFDSQGRVAAVAHCGWRGICSGVVSNAVEVMVNRFGVNPAQVIAVYGPAICGSCYEVGGELKDAFATRFSPDEIELLFTPQSDGAYLLSLELAVTMELRRAGVRLESIYDTGICSFEAKNYPSFRRSGHLDAAKQMFSGIVLM